jgi:putative phosphoesterase
MRIGVVSDTHNHLRNVSRIVELFNAAGVERVVHTGDITQAKTLCALAHLDAPLVGVYGNNDLERSSLEAASRRYGMRLLDPPLRLDWGGRRVLVVHDPAHLGPAALSSCDVALHGHDHWRHLERRGGALVLNPGECAGHLPGHNAVAVLDLASLAAQILHF